MSEGLGPNSLKPVALGQGALGIEVMGGLAFGVEATATVRRNDPTGIIRIATAVEQRLIADLAAEPERLRSLDWRIFEELVAELFRGFGYEVELTAKTRDGGKDVVAIRKAETEDRYIIQCKRVVGTVGVSAVRELMAVREDERATKGIIATTARFSRDASLLLERHRWQMEGRDFDGLIDWIGRYIDLCPGMRFEV